MAKITRLSATQRDNLVAFLDGELNEQEAKDIERSLVGNRVVQHEVEMLSRTWDMLDLLPKASVTDEFTRQTVSMAKLDTTPFVITEQPWFRLTRRCLVVAGWGAGVAAAALLGFCVTREWIPSQARLLYDNLEVIDHLDQYMEAGDITFLQELKRSGALHDLPAQ